MAETMDQPEAPPSAPPWEDVQDRFKQAFPDLDPEDMRRQYEQHRSLGLARTVVQHYEEPTGLFLARRSFGLASPVYNATITRDYQRAKERFARGEATGPDTNVIASYEKQQEIDANRGLGGQILSALAHVPALAAEAQPAGALALPARLGLAGTIGSKVLSTPAMPSLYLGGAAERAAEQGGEIYDPKNIGPPLASGALQNVVLGTMGNFTKGIKNPATRFLASVGVGMGEMEAGGDVLAGLDNFLPEAFKTKTGYGPIGLLMKGEAGAALKKGAVDFATLAAFHFLHGSPEQGAEVIAQAKDALDQAKESGLPPEKAAEVLANHLEFQKQARQLSSDFQERLARNQQNIQNEINLASRGVGAPEQVPPQGPEPGQEALPLSSEAERLRNAEAQRLADEKALSEALNDPYKREQTQRVQEALAKKEVTPEQAHDLLNQIVEAGEPPQKPPDKSMGLRKPKKAAPASAEAPRAPEAVQSPETAPQAQETPSTATLGPFSGLDEGTIDTIAKMVGAPKESRDAAGLLKWMRTKYSEVGIRRVVDTFSSATEAPKGPEPQKAATYEPTPPPEDAPKPPPAAQAAHPAPAAQKPPITEGIKKYIQSRALPAIRDLPDVGTVQEVTDHINSQRREKSLSPMPPEHIRYALDEAVREGKLEKDTFKDGTSIYVAKEKLPVTPEEVEKAKAELYDRTAALKKQAELAKEVDDAIDSDVRRAERRGGGKASVQRDLQRDLRKAQEVLPPEPADQGHPRPPVAQPQGEAPAGGGEAPGNELMPEQNTGFGQPLSEAEKKIGLGGGQPDAGEGGPVKRSTALANAQTDKELQAKGKPPLMSIAALEDPAAWKQAMDVLDGDPEAGARLVDELAAKNRAPSRLEQMLLLQRKIALYNETDRAYKTYIAAMKPNSGATSVDFARLEQQVNGMEAMVEKFNRVARDTGWELGGSLRLRRLLAAEDYSLTGLMQRAQAAKGKEPLTPEEAAKVAGIQEKIAKADERLAKAESGEEPAEKVGSKGDIADLRIAAKNSKAEVEAFVQSLKRSSRPVLQKVVGGVGEATGLMRSVITSFDLSAVFRQGGFFTFAHPVLAAKAFPESIRALASERGADRAMDAISQRPNAVLYRQSGLYLADRNAGLNGMEEAFLSRLAGKIPGVAASERAYTTFLNRARVEMFDSMAAGFAMKGEATPAEGKVIAAFVNAATGRGNLGPMERAAVPLAQLFFSPRFLASRLQLASGQPLYGGTMKTRSAIGAEYARALAGLGVFYAASKLLGGDDVDITFDPRSADFGKVKMGNTRVDPLAGLAQVAMLTGKVVSGETKSSQTGQVTPIRERKYVFFGPTQKIPYKGERTPEVIGRFLRSKMAPVPGAVLDSLSGENVVGEKVTPVSVAANLAVPISIRDVWDSMDDLGMPKGAAASLLAILGMGTQMYEKGRVQTKGLVNRLEKLVGVK